ncbi:hypothetical protein [Thauera sp. WH-1]|uniref:hypothetical protein n=1 Tax=Thauera sp. WH-1 TaxID=3398230 RepID=UPI0039FC73CE
MSLHPQLAATLAAERAASLAATPCLTQDALTLTLANGTELTVRYAAEDAYSLRWRCADGAELGIDTAPLHAGLASAPNHLHRADGTVVADPLTRIDDTPENNLLRLVDALMRDPLLSGRAA